VPPVTQCGLENLGERGYSVDIATDGMIMLKWILEK
jgi:hypothetical protein